MDHSRKRISEAHFLYLLWPVLDVVSIFISGSIAFYYYFDAVEMHDRYKIAMLTISFLVVIFCAYGDFYHTVAKRTWTSLFFRQLFIWGCVFVSAAALIYLLNVSIRFSRMWVACTLTLAFSVSIILKFFLLKVITLLQLKSGHKNKILVIGSGSALSQFYTLKREQKASHIYIYGVKSTNCEIEEKKLDNIVKNIEEKNIKEVWMAFPLSKGNEIKKIMHALRFKTVEIRFFPELTDLPLINHKVSEVYGLYSIDLCMSPMKGMARALKRAEDLLLGGIISLLILPVCLVIAIVIKITSPGPILFKQYRTGINGKDFKIYKFRSMKVHQEKEGQVTQAMKVDPRITRIGRFLRRTSLDELPQFFNVLQGRMSIVGPRPHALAHNKYYMNIVESYMQRHKVKPGITGWAQVSGLRGETDTVDKMKERVKFDLWYIENWSIIFDIKIVFMTVFKGFFGKNAY